MTAADAHQAITATWKAEAPRLIAGLVRMTRDVGLAEDLAQDALVAALEQWPASGVPDNPGAWLMAIAKRRAVDHFRRAERLRIKQTELGLALQQREEASMPDPGASIDHIEDDVLRLMFVTCHPALTLDSQVALTLRLLGGLTTREIARSFLVPEATIAQRISRAKRALAEAGIEFDVPGEDERPARLASVLRVVYLVFTEGYAATAGDDWMRPALCAEALHLGELLAGLAPDEAEVHGLLALMRLQSSRSDARLGPDGEPVLLRDQDRARWDQLLIRRGLASLDRALDAGAPYGPYTLQAAIAACHARAPSVDATDWRRIAALYDALAEVTPSPVVSLNRAVAHGMAFGPAVGLRLADVLSEEPSLRRYHLLPSIRGEFLVELGRLPEARREYERAASMASNSRERALLLERAAACGPLED